MRASLLLLTSCSWAAPVSPPTVPVQVGVPASLPPAAAEDPGELAAERTRLRRLKLIERLRPSDWRNFVDARGFLTPEGLALVEAEEKRSPPPNFSIPSAALERLDGRSLSAEDLSRAQDMLGKVFDGASGSGPGKSAPAGAELELDARVRNGTIASFTLTDPNKKLSFEAGQIGIDGRTPLVAPSPYFNLTKSGESDPDSWIDYRVKAQLGYVDMKARFFADDAGSGADNILGAAELLGLDSNTISNLRGQWRYSDGYRTQGLLVSSLLAQASRAYNLYGPVDVAAAATSLTKLLYLAPNQAFDQSVGLRSRLPGEELFAGLFGGVTENISPVGNRLFQELTAPDGVQTGVKTETAPHWTAALWGRLPAADSARFSASVGRRYNQDTTTSQAELSLMADVSQVPMALRVKDSREKGDVIEFDRHKQSLQLEAQLTSQLRGFVSGERERFRYGNAEVASDALYAGITIDLDGRRRGNGRASITVDQALTSDYKSKPFDRPLPEFAQEAAKAVAGGLEAADRAVQLAQLLNSGAGASQIDAALNDLSLALSRLPPDASAALIARIGSLPLTDDQRLMLADVMLRVVPPGSDVDARLRQALADALGSAASGILDQLGDPSARAEFLDRLRADIREAESLLGILADANNWNSAATAVARAALLRELSQDRTLSIPILDQSITFQTHAPVLIAAAGALNSRLSPLAPVTASDVEPWLLGLAGKELGLGSNATSEQIAAKLIELGQQRIQQAVDQQLTPAVTQLLASSSYDQASAASAILSALPSAAADALRGRFGSDLEGLLPPSGASAEDVLNCLQNLTTKVNDILKSELSGPLASSLSQMASWAADLVSHEINLEMIHLLVASEEFDRLTVDHGRKASDLGTDMLRSSFGRLDERRRAQASRRLSAMRVEAASRYEKDQTAFIQKLTNLGQERLAELQRGPSWPRGLDVSVRDSSWAPLLASYGDAAFFDLLGRIAARRRASGKTAPLDVTFEFRQPSPTGGIEIVKLKDGGRHVVLPAPGNARRAAFFLSNLEDLID